MNQLFYNIAGGIEHQIRREKRTTILEVIVRVKRNVVQNRNWFYFEFSSKFILKVETDQFVICLVLPECFSVKICCISGSNSEANRDGAGTESSFPLFFSFSTSFKNFSPREKVGNCLRFWTGGWSLCFYPLWSRNIWIFFPTLTMAAPAKKNSGKAI